MSLHHDAMLSPTLSISPGDALMPPPPARPKRDLKKMALIVGLSVLAWVSTYTGMLELIQANLGEVGLVEKVATGLAVVMLQIMIVWLLDQLFSPIHLSVKVFYIVGYLFLSLISVGFAFGFYWKVLESRSASTSSAETSIGSVQSALRGAETRLDQLVSTLESLTAISTQKADQESANGNSCPGSKPGAGPRMAMRRGDAEKFSFASTFVKGRSGQVKGDIKALDTDLQRILKDDKTIVDAKTGTRNEFLKGMGRKLEDTTTRYNALRTDPQLRQIRQDAAERAEKTSFPDSKGGTYACPDGQLQSALRGVVAAIDQLPSLEKPKIAATEGSEAVIEAFRRLTMTLVGALQFKLPPTPEELREKQAKAVQAMENPAAAAAAQKAINLEAAGLGKRDYIPLAIAIFVDFCLLMVSFGRPANRFARTAMELKAAELGPQSAIVGINREVHEDRIIRRNFELFQHVVVHFGNHYLAAVPLAAPHKAPDGRALTPQERERLQIDAQTLVTLFSGLELNSAIVDRGLPPFISLMGGARLIRNRLLKQESKFAHSGAFRFYRFRNRAWPEMILGTVMGTAKKYHHELAERRAEEAVIERESRQIEAEERKAANAQRKAENAQRIAEAELRTMEAQMRQRAIEGQLHEAARMRGQMTAQRPMAPMPPHLAAMAGRGGPRPVGAHPSQTGHPAHGHAAHGYHASGPGGAPAPGPFGRTATAAVYPQPAPVQPVHHMPHNIAPHHIPATPAGHEFIEPANHNTAPPERGRMPAGFGVVGAPLGDPRALPANVVPMPERLERTHPGEPAATATALPGREQPGRESASMEMAHAAFTRMQGTAPPAMTPAAGSHSLPAVVAPGDHQAEVSKSTAPLPHMPVPHMPAAAADNGNIVERSVAPSHADLSSLLRTVAVTQMRVAHDVAQAVHRIENPQESFDRRTGDGSIAGPADGKLIDAVAEPETRPVQDHPALHPGRGLAHDPHFDDAGSIAARYAPAQRPQ